MTAWTKGPTCPTRSNASDYTPENYHGTQQWSFGRWLSFLIGWFLGSMLIFQGLCDAFYGSEFWSFPSLEATGIIEKPNWHTLVFQSYGWWTKSCTSWYGKYPIIHQVSTIPGGCLGFRPSTVPTFPIKINQMQVNIPVPWILRELAYPSLPVILLMDKILHHLGCIKPCK